MLSKHRIRAAFSRAAASYDHVTQLHRQVGEQLLALLQPCGKDRVLDVGMGTGYLASVLARYCPGIGIYGCDIAHQMNKFVLLHKEYGKIYPATCDAEHLGYKSHSLDSVISNLSLQWLPDLSRGLKEIHRVLKPGGRIAVSLFGEGTLNELYDSYASAYRQCKGKPFEYAHMFVSGQELADKLTGCNFKVQQVSLQNFQILYPEVKTLLKALAQMGAKNASLNRPRGLVGRRLMQRMEQVYRERYSEKGMIRSSFRVIMASAVKATGRRRDE